MTDAVIPYLSPHYWEAQELLVQSCRDFAVSDIRAQITFSHILRNRLWRQAVIWIDPDTGDEYHREKDIPKEIRAAVSVEYQFKWQKNYLDHCAETIPGFARATFLHRHSMIDKWMEAGMPLEEATVMIAGHGLWSWSKLAQRVLVYDREHNVVGYNPEIAENLPTLPAPLEEIPEENRVDAVRDSLVRYAREARAAVEDGAQQGKITGDVRRDLLREPDILVYVPQDNPALFAISCTESSGDKFEVPETVKFYINFTQADTGEIVSELPLAVYDWLVRRLKVPH